MFDLINVNDEFSNLLSSTAIRGFGMWWNHEEPNHGYVIPHSEYGIRLSLDAKISDVAREFEKMCAFVAVSKEHTGVGLWLDEEYDCIYIDPLTWVADAGDALCLARVRDEMFIFDAESEEVIPT